MPDQPEPAELLERYGVTDREAWRLRVNFISSIDGAATRDGLSGGFEHPADQAVFEILRRLADAVLVGAGTLRAEGYGGLRVSDESAAWREAHGLPPHPRLVIASGRLDLDPTSALFADAPVRPAIVTTAEAPAERAERLAAVADVLVCGEDAVDPARMRAGLEAAGVRQLLCEGGPSLFGSLIEADAVDEMCLSIAPTLEAGAAPRISRGSGAEAAPRSMRLLHALPADDLVLLRYERSRDADRSGADS